VDGRAPIIVGVGQVTQRPETERPREPLALMAEAARNAERDAAAHAGAGDILHELDSIRIVNVFSWPSKDPPHDLGSALGVSPREALFTALGGNTTQWQVNEAADAIHRGVIKFSLIAGGECVYSTRRARTKGIDLGWSARGHPTIDVGDVRPGTTETETTHGAVMPINIYPMFENAIRAHYGNGLDEHRASLGELFEPFSATAAQNPYAWFREAKTAHQISTPTPDNRYIGFPYTRSMNAIIDVDQASATLVTSVAEARRLKIPEEKWVYLWGCGDATDHWFVSQRENYYTSPAIEAMGKRAFDMSGTSVGDIDYFDLYSCFPSAVQISRDMLSIPKGDPRPLTVTGGLPYFGGPGNNYVGHSIASMTEKLRANRGKIGLVTANGWYVTKHSCGIYSTDEPRRAWERADPKLDQKAIDARPKPEFADEPSGSATVETYTVMFNRDGAPESAIVFGRDSENRRFIANAPPDRRVLEQMVKQEMVGAKGRVARAASGTTNVFTPS
jgi:acetyl-CoA C-acetyltransferase